MASPIKSTHQSTQLESYGTLAAVANDILEASPRFGLPRQTAPEVDLVPAVEGTLTEFLDGQISALGGVDPALGRFATTTRDLVLARGKRLRPTFAYWGWRGVAAPGEPVEPVLLGPRRAGADAHVRAGPGRRHGRLGDPAGQPDSAPGLRSASTATRACSAIRTSSA
nr:hypothetical protein GCM10020092_000080 [Actinoplanes digitatis]